MDIGSVLNLVIGIFIGSGAGAVVGTYVGYRTIKREGAKWLQSMLEEFSKRNVVHNLLQWLKEQCSDEFDDTNVVHSVFEWLKEQGLGDEIRDMLKDITKEEQ